ncbi:MAG TPA: M43 family zinc metalloprotease [Chitinophagaceae bacterium]|nr:M43 family zinc metalloprotease [Chitinophagaceae bacterium]
MKHVCLILLLFCSAYLFAQDSTITSCGQHQATDNLFKKNPSVKALHEQMESRLYQFNRAKLQQPADAQHTAAIVTLPVVVHVIHNNGPENISDAQVQTAIQHLNEAFANTGYYNPADGVNTQIQFCLARRDPNGNATNGINRVVSPLTVMNGWQDYDVDLAVKDLSRWNPLCYVNIWVVGDITGGVAGYAYLPSAHGSNVDGIVLEARYFGTSYANDIVVIHEMGHYLGLYHTFQGGCSNNDCLTDGDRICDTPPDQSTVGVSCNTSVNSCTTDAQSGFSTDQNDLHKDYMDYGNWNCMSVFTQGQSDRMNWVVQNVRRSLLNCMSCQDPCPASVTAAFTASANNVATGTLVNFTNSSSNATGYRWYINAVLQSATANFSYTFNVAGTFVIRLVALPGNILCDSAVAYDTVRVTCPITANFSPLSTTANTNVTVNFTNTSAGATTYAWYVDGVLQGTGLNFSYAFTSAGNYVIKLRAANGACADSIGGTVVVNDTCLLQTFQKTYGGAGDDVAYDVRSTTDGGYIMAGKTNSFGSGAYDGYVVKMDQQGNVQWSRTYGGANDDVINKLLQTPDGGYILAGQTKSYGNAAGDAWIIKTDGNGAVQWAKRYSESTVFGEQAINICLTSDGGYGVVGSHNSAPATSNVMVLKLDANGNVLWSRIYDSGNTDGGSWITEENGFLMTTAFTRTSLSYHDGIVMKIDMVSGNMIWMQRYEVDGRNNFGGELFKVGNGYRFHIPSIQDFSNLNTGRNITLTLDANGNATAVRQLVPPDFGNGPIIITPDGSEVAVYNEQNTVSEFNIMKISSNNTVQWAKKYLRPGPQLNYIIRASQDGGFITIGASNPAAANDIYLAKVDVQGNSPGCDTARIAVTVQTPPFSSGAFSWAISRSANFANPISITVQSGLVNTAASALCTGTTCVDTIPADTCNDFTFQKIIGQSGHDEARDIKKTADGGMIIAGLTTAFGSLSDALIVKTDNKGNIQWSRKYGLPGVNEWFNEIIPTSDGNYIAAGWGKFNPNHQGDAWIVKIRPDGSIIWSRAYGAATPNGEIAKFIRQTDDGGYIVGVDYSAPANQIYPLYMRLDANGNVIWNRLLAVDRGATASGAEIIGDVVMVAGIVFKGTSVFADSYIAKLSMADGSLLWTRDIESEGRSNRIQQMRRRGNELVFGMQNSNSVSTGSIKPIIFKTDTSGNVIYSRSYEVAGVNPGSIYASVEPTADGGYIANLSELTANTSPRLVKISAAGAVNWVSNFTPQPSQQLYKSFEDTAGFVTAGAIRRPTSTFTDIILIKINRGGLMAGSDNANCPVTASTAVDNSILVQSIPAPLSYWTSLGSANIQSITASVTAEAVALTQETLCIDTADCNQPPPPVDTCNDFTYIKKYATADSTEQFAHTILTNDNHLLVAGHAVDIPDTQMSGTVFKFRKDGTIVWQKKFDVPFFTHAINTSDNNYLLLGAGFTLVKLAPNGNVLWRNQYPAPSPVGYGFLDLIQGSDGNFYIVGTKHQGTTDEYYVTKISAAGALIWSKSYATPSPAIYFLPYDIEDDGNAVMICGQYVITDAIQNRWGFVARINKNDGSVVFSKYYRIGNEQIVFAQIHKYNSTFTITGWHYDNPANSYLFKIDAAGNIVKAREFTGNGVQGSDNRIITAAGEIISTNRWATTNPGSPYILSMYKLDTSWTPVWTNRYNQLKGNFSGRNIIQSGPNIYVGGNTSTASKTVGTLIRFTHNGRLATCASDTFTISYTDPTVIVTSFNHPAVLDVPINSSTLPASTTPWNAQLVETACSGQVGRCDTLAIGGADTVCNFTDTVRYTTLRDSTCTQPVQWSIDTSFAKIIAATDSTIDLRFKKTGSVYLYGTITTACAIIKDSILVSIFNSPDAVNLGPDRQLCEISTTTLNAGGGFRSYRWQDGSADSIFTVHLPGTYFVEATDYCGEVFTDTIVITLAPAMPFDLGADLATCDGDTVTITAPAGFTKYTWADNYNIDNRYTREVRVWPAADTTYSVVAETSTGCLVYDSIRITVRNKLPLDIGADTSFCQNDSLTIDANTGFTAYSWNTGETTQQIIVKNKGIYHVMATAPNGCISKDSLEVMDIYALPVVSLGKDTIICQDNFYIFDAGIFPAYIWHDGSTSRTFTASQPGKYWVQVASTNGCMGSDTAEILRIAAPPQNFLDTAAEFCPHEKTTLTAKGSFVRYRWSTGSVSPSIQTNIAGTYWLEVTNADGCTNREFIHVKTKFCKTSIDFPNAFTPNNDRRHESYKPVIKGVLVKYTFSIYNRWGQRVFETNDPTRAWDGTLGGKPQDSGAFVWICTYQFAGEELKFAKGTLLLVR